eukprot:g16150.t1
MRLAPEPIMQMRPSYGEEEALATAEYVRSGGFMTEHRQSRKLEAELANFIGVKHAILNCNGTLAISAALNALGIRPGDQILVPTYTMVASANACRFIGAIPVLCDVDGDTNTISPEIVRPFLENENLDIKCVIHVSLNNRVKGLAELVALCKERKVFLLEDAAQSLGVFYNKEKHLGTYGDVATFSFSSPKIISMGQGGLIVTNNDDLADKLRKNKDFGRARPGVEEYEDFGINMKVTDLQATVGLEQMKKLPKRIEKMRAIYETYFEILGELMSPPLYSGGAGGNKEKSSEESVWVRDALSAWLSKIGIGTRKVYPSIHLQPAYNASSSFAKDVAKQLGGYDRGHQQTRIAQSVAETIVRFTNAEKPVARKVMETGLWLPSYSDLPLAVVRQIALAITT